MQSTFPRLRHVFLALDHHIQLRSHLAQFAKDISIPSHEPKSLVSDPRLLAELHHFLLQAPQIMARHAREKVVHGLELQSSMYEIQPCGTIDVHGRAELMLRETFPLAEIARRHRPMGEGDLHVQRHGDDVRDQHKHDAKRPGWYAPPYETVPEQKPVHGHEGDLSGTRPRCGAEIRGAR